jgi:GT2 family glycosyltransferase
LTYGRIGPLDAERFGGYGWGAEVDYSLRTRRAGMRICVTELSYLSHLRHATARTLSADCEAVASVEMDQGMRAKWGATWTQALDQSVRALPREDSIALITPSVPERAQRLAECIASVATQTRTPDEHFVGIDHERIGVANMLNRLAERTSSAWLAVLADDDLLDPCHLDVLIAEAEGADIVYAFCRVTGRGGWSPNRDFDPAALRRANYIPATALIRYSLWERLGGWSERQVHEDHEFWLRALDAGATFRCIPRVTWTYRFHGGNRSTTGRSA